MKAPRTIRVARAGTLFVLFATCTAACNAILGIEPGVLEPEGGAGARGDANEAASGGEAAIDANDANDSAGGSAGADVVNDGGAGGAATDAGSCQATFDCEHNDCSFDPCFSDTNTPPNWCPQKLDTYVTCAQTACRAPERDTAFANCVSNFEAGGGATESLLATCLLAHDTGPCWGQDITCVFYCACMASVCKTEFAGPPVGGTLASCLSYCHNEAPDRECQAMHCYNAIAYGNLDHCNHAIAKPGTNDSSNTFGCRCPACSNGLDAGADGFCHCPSDGGTDAATD